MNSRTALKFMENEIRCIQRARYCDRNCAKCPLVKDEKELIEAYGMAINALEKQEKIREWIARAELIGANKLMFDGKAVVRILERFLEKE